MILRKVNLEDVVKNKLQLEKYIEIIIEGKEIENKKKKTQEIYENMKKFIEDGTAIIIGAFENDIIIGFIWAYEMRKKVYHVNYFCVREDYRKKGIGQELLEELYKTSKKSGIEKIELLVEANNEKAMKLYKRNSFEEKYIKMEKNLGEYNGKIEDN